MSVKESDNATICDSASLGQSFVRTTTCALNGSRQANENEDGTIDERKPRNADKLMLSKTRESRNSGSVHITISDIFDVDAELSADNNVLACESPNSTLFAKEDNSHILEDTRVDEDENVNKSLSDDGLSASALGNATSMSNYELLARFRQRMSEEHTSEDCDPEDSMRIDATRRGSTGKIAADASQEESFVDRLLPVQEFGTRSFLRSFLNPSLDHGLSASRESQDGQKEDLDDQPNNISCNSKVEIRSIAKTEEQSGNVHDHVIQAISIKNKCAEDVSEQAFETRNLNNPSCKNDDEQVEPRVMSHRRKISGEFSAVGLVQHDKGDPSFSAAAAGGLVSFSGKIAYSGSLSLQSDGSATSGRSFAFPLLQSEWNTSPVRMVKPDGSGFRKQQGWRSGLLCCRF